MDATVFAHISSLVTKEHTLFERGQLSRPSQAQLLPTVLEDLSPL